VANRLIANRLKGKDQYAEIDQMSWKKLSSRAIFDNPWISVREDHVLNPGGGENDYGVVHFKNKAIAIIPVDVDGNTWLVGQDRYAVGEYSWELPMGGAPHAEDPLLAAKRELKEETGLVAQRWSKLMFLHISNSVTDEVGIVYVAEDLLQGDQQLGETENITLRKLPLVEAVEMAKQGVITDVISVAALLRIVHSDQ